MHQEEASFARKATIWVALILAIAIPTIASAFSPQLQWRDPVYILAGFSGVISLGLLLVQPLLIGGFLPGLSPINYRRLHRWIGGCLVTAVIVHVAALWMTSPPDVIDALLLASPTPFSIWGVFAMWAVFATALLAATRKRLRMRPKIWLGSHKTLALIIILGSVVHAMLIEGTMEFTTKIGLCVLVVIFGLWTIIKHPWHK